MFKNQKGAISTLIVAGALIFLTASTIITSLLIKNRLSLNPKAAILANDCVNGITEVAILQNGTALPENAIISNLSNLSCKIHVQGVTRADTALVCAFQVGDQPWVIGCPNSPGDFVQVAPPGQPITGNNVTTTFTKCSQNLLNPPAGYHSPQPGEAIQARAIRRVGSCTTDNPPIPWKQQGYYATGTNFSLLTAVLPTSQPTSQPSTTPQTSQTALYISPNPATVGTQITVTATGTTFCSGNISDPPVVTNGGFNGCVGPIEDSFACSGNPMPDGKPCWWRWTCNASNNAGTYLATFTGANNNSSCTSTAFFTIQSATTPTPTTPVGGNSRIFINPPGLNGDIIMTVFAVPDCSTNIVTKIDGIEKINVNEKICQPILGSPGNLGYNCGNGPGSDPGNPIAKYGLDRSTYPCWWQLKCNPVSNDLSITHTARFSTEDKIDWCSSSKTFKVNPSKQDIKQPTCTGVKVFKNNLEVPSGGVVHRRDTITVQAQGVANATRIRFAMTRADSPTCRVNRDTGQIYQNFYDIGSDQGLVLPTPPSTLLQPTVNSNSFQIPSTATIGNYYVFANPAAIYSYRERGSNNPPYSWIYTSNPAADNSADPYVNQFWCTNNGANDGSKCNGNYCDDVAMADKVPLISRNNVNGQLDCVTVLTITN